MDDSQFVHLTPLKSSKKQIPQQAFGTLDTETKDGLIGKELYCWSYCVKTSKEGLEFTEQTKFNVLQGNDDLTRLFNIFYQRIYKYRMRYRELNSEQFQKQLLKLHYHVIYIHNLGFDIRFLIEFCIKNEIKFKPIISSSNYIACVIDELRIRFEDSYQFLREKQEIAEIEWNIPEQYRKKETDSVRIFKKKFEDWSEADKKNVYKHNKNDVIALWICMHYFRLTIYEISSVDCISIYSIASLSMKGLRICLKQAILNPFLYYVKGKKRNSSYEIDWKKEKFVRDSYYGGRNELFSLEKMKDMVYIDKVSMYSWAMKYKPYPVGQPKWFGYNQIELHYLEQIIDEKIDKLGFILAKIEKGNFKSQYSVLPKKIDKKTMFTDLTMYGIWTIAELRYARKMGYKITLLKGLIYPEYEYIFTSFVDKFFAYKLHASGGKRIASKRFLNTPYGKFGQKFIMDGYIFHYFLYEETMLEFMNLYQNPEKLDAYFDESFGVYIVAVPYESIIKKSFMNVGIASYVTSYCRLELLQKIHELEEKQIYCKYCDTDSITISKKESNEVELKKELGSWDIEKEFKIVKFLAPKAYISLEFDEKEQKEKWVLKLKGVQKYKLKEIVSDENLYKKINCYGFIPFSCIDIEMCEQMDKIMFKEIFYQLILREVRQKIIMNEVYMKFNESMRCGIVRASKIPTKEYSYENMKRKFIGNNSVSWNDENAPIEYKEQLLSEYQDKYSEWINS